MFGFQFWYPSRVHVFASLDFFPFYGYKCIVFTNFMPVQKGPVRIRPLEFDDLSPVYHLGAKLFTAAKWPVLYRTWDQYEILERFIGDPGLCVVAESNEEIVGFAIGTIIEKSSWSYGYLLWLGVDERMQSLGVGKKLHDKMERLFIKEGARIMMIDTASDNEKALAFFKRQGFDNIEEHVYLTKSLSTLAKAKGKVLAKKSRKKPVRKVVRRRKR